jgi:hypothetical protein
MKPSQEQVEASKDTIRDILTMFIEKDTDHGTAMVSLATALSVIAHALSVPREKLCESIGAAWDFVDKQQKGTIQ